MEQILSRYGYNSVPSEHKQSEQQLLLCSSQENGAVVYLYAEILYHELLHPFFLLDFVFSYMVSVVAVAKRGYYEERTREITACN